MSRLFALLAAAFPAFAAPADDRVKLDASDPLATPSGLVDGATARRLVEAGAKVLDVRTPSEFAAGHVPGAVNIPFDQVAARAAELGTPRTPVVLYCRTGRRSELAAQTLRQLGFERIWDLQSFEAWPR